MRLEISINGQRPEQFPLDSSALIIGSSESCDIRLQVSGISRKHLQVIKEEDKYFVIDQGSTNGSYINEERLTPGRRVEFNTFFPIRLGANVVISLVNDDRSNIYNRNSIMNKPRPVAAVEEKKLKEEFPGTKTDLQVMKKESAIKKKSPVQTKKKQDDSLRMFFTFIFMILILFAAYYFTQQQENAEEDEFVEPNNETQVTPSQQAAPVQQQVLVAEADLVNKEDFNRFVNDIKCTTDLEKYLCDTIPGLQGHPVWGVIQVGMKVNILISQEAYLKRIQEKMADKKLDEKQMQKLVFVEFLKDLPELNYGLLKDVKINIAFYDNEESKQVLFVMALLPQGLQNLKNLSLRQKSFQASSIDSFARTY
ncbi:MAG: FHA domain-containing protein [Bacteriovoracaceae bacterium]